MKESDKRFIDPKARGKWMAIGLSTIVVMLVAYLLPDGARADEQYRSALGYKATLPDHWLSTVFIQRTDSIFDRMDVIIPDPENEEHIIGLLKHPIFTGEELDMFLLSDKTVVVEFARQHLVHRQTRTQDIKHFPPHIIVQPQRRREQTFISTQRATEALPTFRLLMSCSAKTSRSPTPSALFGRTVHRYQCLRHPKTGYRMVYVRTDGKEAGTTTVLYLIYAPKWTWVIGLTGADHQMEDLELQFTPVVGSVDLMTH